MADPKYANLPGIVSFRWNFIYTSVSYVCLLSYVTYQSLQILYFNGIRISSTCQFLIHKPCSKLQYQVICLQGCKLVDAYVYELIDITHIHITLIK